MVKRPSLFHRRYFRVPFNTAVEFNILKYRENLPIHLSTKTGTGISCDLGEDGISFLSDYHLPVDMIIRITLNLPQGDKRYLARVVRTQPSGKQILTAVQFINLNGFRREDLRSFIISETRKQYRFLKYI